MPAEHELTVDGRRIVHLDYGNPEAFPLVLVHGYTAFPHEWDDVATELVPIRHVIAAGLRGHGTSDWADPGDYPLHGFVEDLAAQVDELGLAEFDLLGHSMGGAVAIAYTAQHPGRVRRLVIVDAGPIDAAAFASEDSPRPVVPSSFPNRAAAEEYLRSSPAFAGFPSSFADCRLEHALRELDDGAVAWRCDLAHLPSAFGPPNGAEFGEVLWDQVAAIPCPTLLMRAGASPVLPSETAERMLTSNPCFSYLEVPGAAHWIQVTHPDVFLGAVRAFLGAREGG